MALWTLGVAAVLALIERAVEYLDIFLTSVLTLFPAGVILTLSVLVFSTLWHMVPARNASDRATAAFLRISAAIPLSLLVAASIAGATTLLSMIMLEEVDGGQFIAFFWWWIPAAFGLTMTGRPLKGALVAIVLLIASGTIDTYALYWSTSASDYFQLEGRSAGDRQHMVEWRFNSRDAGDFVGRSLAFIWSQFDPRRFLSVVGNPFVPPAFSSRAEEQHAEDKSHAPQSARLDTVGHLIQKVGWLSGCAEALSPDERPEIATTLYWQPREVAELAIVEAHQGGFCTELRRGLQSGMIRSWVVLLFFGWGIARAVRAPATAASGPQARRAVVLTTLTAVFVLVLAALAIRWEVPSEPVITVGAIFLPDDGGQAVLSWTARHAHHSRWWVEPNHEVKELTRPAETKVRFQIPPNRDDLPAWYTFTVEARGILNNRSRKSRVTIVVAPGAIIRDELKDLPSERNDTVSAATVDQYGSVYLTGSSSSGEIPTFATIIMSGAFEDRGGMVNSFVAKVDPRGSLRWRVKLGEGLVTSAVAVDRAENVYLGGTVRSIQPSPRASGQKPPPPSSLLEPSVRSHAYVKKLDSQGVELWTQVIAADENEVLSALSTDTVGNVYAVGTVGPSPLGMEMIHVETDVFLAKYDPHGNRLWLVQFGTNKDDGATGVAVDTGGTIYVTGFTEAPPYPRRFDPDVTGRSTCLSASRCQMPPQPIDERSGRHMRCRCPRIYTTW
jgi:hypothetical protein